MLNIHLYNSNDDNWLFFNRPLDIITTSKTEQVSDCLQKIEKRVNEENLWAAGYLAYESAPAFDPHFKVHTLKDYPLLKFGLYKSPTLSKEFSFTDNKSYTLFHGNPGIDETTFKSAISEIKTQIRNGNTYQVNYTFPLYFKFTGSYYELFHNMFHAQQCKYAALIEDNEIVICSASPELFFDLDKNILTTKPMKGTATRGNGVKQDLQLKRNLYKSQKNRAENVMIVDMLRNDMGHVSEFGSVKVEKLFEIEQYPTVWQMTSTIKSKTFASMYEIFKALFPCASITGAPKVKTMEIINNIEKSPRGIYTGSIGYIAPNRKARFNVAIRTLTLNKNSEKTVYNVGSGIVWDSQTESEYNESLLKAKILEQKHTPFQLLETLLWEIESGYFLIDYHLKRLHHSARYFGFHIDIQSIRNELHSKAKSFIRNMRVRLLLEHYGTFDIQSFPLETKPAESIKVCFANNPVDSFEKWLYHKTTKRDIYEQHLSAHPDFDDVLLYNEKNEITEACLHNIVVEIDQKLYTPPIKCGLLAGTFRQHLLNTKEISERIIPKNDLIHAESLYLINSVRKWRQCEIFFSK